MLSGECTIESMEGNTLITKPHLKQKQQTCKGPFNPNLTPHAFHLIMETQAKN